MTAHPEHVPRSDPEVDYGCWWKLPSGQHARLSWNQGTGVLYLSHPDRGGPQTALVMIPERHAVEELLTGIWEGDTHRTLQWLADRLWLVGATLPDWAVQLSTGD